MGGSSTDTPNASVSRFGQRKLDDTPHQFVIGGHKVECYFSPSDGTTSHIVSSINAAQHTIGFELLTITRTDISAALLARKGAGLPVRGDMDNGTDTGSQYSALVAGGVDVKLNNGAGLLHHKYGIFDAENQLVATLPKMAKAARIEKFLLSITISLIALHQLLENGEMVPRSRRAGFHAIAGARMVLRDSVNGA